MVVFKREWPQLLEEGWRYSRGNGLISWIYVVPDGNAIAQQGEHGKDYYHDEKEVLDSLPGRGRTRNELKTYGDGAVTERLAFGSCADGGRISRTRNARDNDGDDDDFAVQAAKEESLKQLKREERRLKREKEVSVKLPSLLVALHSPLTHTFRRCRRRRCSPN